MLEVTSSAEENRLDIDFAEVYRKSDLFQYVQDTFSWTCVFLSDIDIFLKLYSYLFFRFNKELVQRLSKPSVDSKEINFPTKYSRPYFDQFVACLWKQHLSYWRNPQYTAVRFFYTVIISLMLGTICWEFGSKRFMVVTYICYNRSCQILENKIRHVFFLFLVLTEDASPNYHEQKYFFPYNIDW